MRPTLAHGAASGAARSVETLPRRAMRRQVAITSLAYGSPRSDRRRGLTGTHASIHPFYLNDTMPLELTPNEVVGYRFAADWYNINVVLVKRHGPNSKHAGQEYAQVLAHCKDVDQAGRWLLNHILRAQGEDAQANRQALDGSVASMTALLELVESAVAQVNAATVELQGRIDALGISQKELVKALGGQDAAGEDGADGGVAEG